ncbi:HNH endonuclease [Clostridium sardiniense]|uniref:HNH endonuclease n=1 Tax=Clostridium sardiniense TaxID=29369 RepID=UPI003D3366E6
MELFIMIIFIIIILIGYGLDEYSKENYEKDEYSEQKYKRELTEGQDWYHNTYLKSEHWERTRDRALKRAGYRCEECGSNKNLNVHHKTYDNIWNERDEDLEVLCQPCHYRRHFESA